MCILTKMIHGKKVSNFIFSFAPTKLHNFPLCQVSLVLPWSPLGPTQNPIFNPHFHCLCVCPKALTTIICHSIQALFWPSKKERKKEKRWYLYQYPLFQTLRVNIDKNKTQYKQWHPSELCHVNIYKTKNIIWTMTWGYVGSTKTYILYKLADFFWIVNFDWLGSVLSQKGHLTLEL